MSSEQFPLSMRRVQEYRKEVEDMTIAEMAREIHEIKLLLTAQQSADLRKNSEEAAISAAALTGGETAVEDWRGWLDRKNRAVLTPIDN
jgi:hypothetical protein